MFATITILPLSDHACLDVLAFPPPIWQTPISRILARRFRFSAYTQTIARFRTLRQAEVSTATPPSHSFLTTGRIKAGFQNSPDLEFITHKPLLWWTTVWQFMERWLLGSAGNRHVRVCTASYRDPAPQLNSSVTYTDSFSLQAFRIPQSEY